jgi:integrase
MYRGINEGKPMGRLAFGAIDKQRSGRFRARYTHPLTPFNDDGSPNRISAPTTFRTKTEAQTWLAGVQADIAKGIWKSPERIETDRLEAEHQAHIAAITFGDYATTWMDTRNHTPATRRANESNLNVHLLPQWGTTPLRHITTSAIREWLALLAPGAPGARKKAFELFRAIMNSAADDELIPVTPVKRNMLGTTKPAPIPSGHKQRTQRTPHALTLHQLEALAAELPEYLRLMVLLDGLTGMRAGEVRALQGQDITTSNDGTTWIHIRRAYSGQGKDLRLAKPKTPKSVRVIPCPPSLAHELIALAKTAGKTGLVFHTVADKKAPIPHGTFADDIAAAARRAGLGKVSPHDLRHTAASIAIANGAPATVVRDLVGHTTTSMTDRYTHTSPEELARIMANVDRERQRPAGVASMEQWRKQG